MFIFILFYFCHRRRGDELEVYSRFSGTSYCPLRELVEDYKNGTGDFFHSNREAAKMMALK